MKPNSILYLCFTFNKSICSRNIYLQKAFEYNFLVLIKLGV